MRTPKTSSGMLTGFTLAELSVVIAIVSIFMVLLLPVFAMAHDRSHRSGTVSYILPPNARDLAAYAARHHPWRGIHGSDPPYLSKAHPRK